jgi:hypothetical protein
MGAVMCCESASESRFALPGWEGLPWPSPARLVSRGSEHRPRQSPPLGVPDPLRPCPALQMVSAPPCMGRSRCAWIDRPQAIRIKALPGMGGDR